MSISVGTRGVPARAPPSFQSVPHVSCTTNEILHTVPPQSKSLSYASDELDVKLYTLLYNWITFIVQNYKEQPSINQLVVLCAPSS